MKIRFSILHPTARPQACQAIYDAWIGQAANPASVEYIRVCDERWGFESCRVMGRPERSQLDAGYFNYTPYQHSGYVSAVNIAAHNSQGDILVVVADDQFPMARWDEALLNKISLALGPAGDFAQSEYVVEVSTGTPNEHERAIMVMPVLSRARYEALGYVFYPGYESMFADNEFCERAREDGIVIDARDLYFEHRHWINDKRSADSADLAQNHKALYRAGETLWRERRATSWGARPDLVGSPKPAGIFPIHEEQRSTPATAGTPATGAAAGNEAASARTVALCLLGERFEGAWVDGVFTLYAHMIASGFSVIRLRTPYSTNVYVAREELRQAVLGLSPRPDFVLWLDDDNICSPAHFDKLVSDLDGRPDLDGVTGWCWIHHPERKTFLPSCGMFGVTNAHWDPFPAEFSKSQDLRPVEASGFPCFLMRLSAIEKAGERPFIAGIIDPLLESGLLGEDMAFMRAAAAGGARFAVDPTVRVPHLKYCDWQPVLIEEGLPQVRIATMLRVKNEARWIARVIDSVKELGPVFLMDDGSTDDTREIAELHGAHVLLSPFVGQPLDECRDKNWLLAEICRLLAYRPDWVLLIDGDEELQPGGVEKIRRACASGSADVFGLRVLNLWDSLDQARFDGVYSQMTRFSLFRFREDLEFRSFYERADGGAGKPPHVGLHTSNAPLYGDGRELVGAALNVWLLHYGYLLKADRLRKYRWYNAVDPQNEIEDRYRHIVQGDLPEVPAGAVLRHAGPLELRKIPRSMIPNLDLAVLEASSAEKSDSRDRCSPKPAGLELVSKAIPQDSDGATWLRMPKPGGPDPVISVLHPTARLPWGWFEAFLSWYGNCENPSKVEWILCIDRDQAKEFSWAECDLRLLQSGIGRGETAIRVVVNHGRRCFVDAVNYAAEHARGAVLVQAEDDYFPCSGWDGALLEVLGDPAQPKTVMVDAQYLDGLMGAAILTRAYYQRFGYIYYPEYLSMGADNDLHERAVKDGVMIDARSRLKFEHRNPGVGKAEMDDVYRREQSEFAKALRDTLWPFRRHLGYPVENLRLMQSHMLLPGRCGECGTPLDEPHAHWCKTRRVSAKDWPAADGFADRPAELRLNLGCSDRLEAGFVNVDCCDPCDLRADLRAAWPWDDSTVDEIRAWDIIEHLPDKLHTMNEAFRVLKPGGVLDIVVPTTDGRGAFQDPTHVSYWNENSFFYFQNGNLHLTRFSKSYGIRCAFDVVSKKFETLTDGVTKLHIVLRAVKNSQACAAD